VDVLEELEATVAVWRLEHRDVGVVAVEADGGVGPLSTDRVTAENGQPEVSEEGDRRFEVADGDTDVLELDWHAPQVTKSGRGDQTANDLPTTASSRIAWHEQPGLATAHKSDREATAAGSSELSGRVERLTGRTEVGRGLTRGRSGR